MSSVSDIAQSIPVELYTILGTALLGWFGIKKSSKDKHELRKVARSILADLYRGEVLGNPKLSDPHYAREYLDMRVWEKLGNLGVKKTHTKEVLVDILCGEVIESFQQENLRIALEQLADTAGKVDPNKPTGADIPNLNLPVAEVKPDGSRT